MELVQEYDAPLVDVRQIAGLKWKHGPWFGCGAASNVARNMRVRRLSKVWVDECAAVALYQVYPLYAATH